MFCLSKRIWWVVFWLGVGGEVWAASTVEEEFLRAKNAYEYGNYKDAILRFRRLLYPGPGKLRIESRQREAHKYLALSYYYHSKSPQARRLARREFLRYLYLAPEARLDPALYPPSLVSFFNRIRAKNKQKLKELMRRRRRRNAPPVQVVTLPLERQIVLRSPLINLLPFGLPQLMRREWLKGGLLLAGQVASLGMNITAYFMIAALQIDQGPQRGTFSSEDLEAAKTLQIVQFTAFGLFGALVIYGLIDAFVGSSSRREVLLPQLPALDPQKMQGRQQNLFPPLGRR